MLKNLKKVLNIIRSEKILKYKLKKYLSSIECICLSKEIEKLLKKNNFRKYYVCGNADRESFLKFINQKLV